MRENFSYSVGKAILFLKNQQKFCHRPHLCNNSHIHPALTLYIKLLKLFQEVVCFHLFCRPPLLNKCVDKELIDKAGVGRKNDHRQRLVLVCNWIVTRLVLVLVKCELNMID